MTIEITTLPVDLWEPYRDLRLRALKEEPQAFASTYADNVKFPPERWQKHLRDAGTTGRNWMLFARIADMLVGMIGAYIDEEDAAGEARIVAMYVAPEARGQGIARQLMEEMLNTLRRDGIRKVTLQVNQVQKTAVRLYERCGFSILGEFQFKSGAGTVDDDYLMGREL